MSTDEQNNANEGQSRAEGANLTAGLGWRCPDCCGTGTTWMGVEAEVECSTCEGEGWIYSAPNDKLRGCPHRERMNEMLDKKIEQAAIKHAKDAEGQSSAKGATLNVGLGEKLRMDAYYYGFTETGVPEIDRILSAVACAGKAFHHTSEWCEDASAYKGHEGMCPLDWIQNAANDAAKKLSPNA